MNAYKRKNTKLIAEQVVVARGGAMEVGAMDEGRPKGTSFCIYE